MPTFDTKQKYIDYVDRCISELTPEQKASLFNGCGSDGGDSRLKPLIKIIRVPTKYQKLFWKACFWHDIAGWLGGNEQQKLWSDNQLFYLMFREARIAKDVGGVLWALQSWIAVRIGWRILKVGWQYAKEPRTVRELHGGR